MARDEKIDLLHRIPLFNTLDRHKVRRLGELADEVEVPSGKVLMQQGEEGDELMVIVRGQVGIERDGTRLNTLGPGDVFGEIALVAHGPRTATATTEEPTTLLVVGHREFHSLMEEFPEVADQVLHILGQRLRRLEADAH